MNHDLFSVLETDRKVIELLRGFIPERVFDAHCHMYEASFIPRAANPDGVFCLERNTPDDYAAHMKPFLPGVETLRLNLIPMPDPALRNPSLRNQANGYVYHLCDHFPGNVCSPYLLMSDTEQQIGDMVSHPGVGAMKCYCYAADTDRYNDCAIGDFLPEAAWVVSNQTGIPIILHMMRPHALSDPDNLSYIRTMARRYPCANLVLAHCARGFVSWTVIDSIREIAGLDNIWYDFAAICESAPMAACIMKTAAKRVMWGSDYPICMHRGRAISWHTESLWLIDGLVSELRQTGQGACLLAGENLLAVRQACNLLELDRTQVEDIFYNNAVRLFRPENDKC